MSNGLPESKLRRIIRELFTPPHKQDNLPYHETEPNRVAQYWDTLPPQEEKKAIAWMEHPRIQQYINSRISGDPSTGWLPYIARKYFEKTTENALSLGCGTGALERHAISLGIANNFDAIDISPRSIQEAQNAAKQEGLSNQISYHVGNLNTITLETHHYDAIFASMSIHHIEALEKICQQIALSLLPGGYFICNEYIGPNRFQLPERRLDVINNLLINLPTSFRRIIRDGVTTTEIKSTHKNPPLSWFTEFDPSEAVHSSEILPVINTSFDIVELTHYGGGLLHFLLENIVGNFDHTIEDHNAWLGLLCELEYLLEQESVIESDFSLIVAKPKS